MREQTIRLKSKGRRRSGLQQDATGWSCFRANASKKRPETRTKWP